jgi:hypothetical protein
MSKDTTMALSKPSLAKPSLAKIQAFAEGATGSKPGAGTVTPMAARKTAPTGQKSGLVPAGDVRLTVNIRGDLHLKLKIRAAQERTTIGELIEQWIAGWKP